VSRHHLNTLKAFFLIPSAPERPSDTIGLFSTSERFATRFLQLHTRSVRSLRLCSDKNVRRNWTACHAYLFTVIVRQNAE